jgi:hypothetical protein
VWVDVAEDCIMSWDQESISLLFHNVNEDFVYNCCWVGCERGREEDVVEIDVAMKGNQVSSMKER